VSIAERGIRSEGERWPAEAAWIRSQEMTQYLISFGAHAMNHIPDEEGPAVDKAALAVVHEAKDGLHTKRR
jgi:hypothetical protein